MTVNDKELSFTISLTDFNEYQGACMSNPGGMVDASHNFLVRAVSKDTKDHLLNLLNTVPGAAVEITGAVVGKYKKPLDIKLGN